MMTTISLEKLNRLRVNAGKAELKSWKASKDKLREAISSLETAGFTDALPGADLNAQAITDDPEVAAARPEPEEVKEKKEPTVTKDPRPALARGLDTELYAKNSRKAVRDHREKEAAEQKAERREQKEAEKAASKKEKKIAGKVDEKSDPDKAERQKAKIKAKQEARAAQPKVEKDPNQITAADVAREVGMDPKVARAKLRRYEGKDEYPKTIPGERWVYPKSAGPALAKILRGDK
jgi:hypothetical protein